MAFAREAGTGPDPLRRRGAFGVRLIETVSPPFGQPLPAEPHKKGGVRPGPQIVGEAGASIPG
jgi:hypothetical protein